MPCSFGLSRLCEEMSLYLIPSTICVGPAVGCPPQIRASGDLEMNLTKTVLRSVFLWCLLSGLAFAQSAPRTMRLDYYHSGNTSQELFSLDRIVLEPLAWPGNLRKTIDDT